MINREKLHQLRTSVQQLLRMRRPKEVAPSWPTTSEEDESREPEPLAEVYQLLHRRLASPVLMNLEFQGLSMQQVRLQGGVQEGQQLVRDAILFRGHFCEGQERRRLYVLDPEQVSAFGGCLIGQSTGMVIPRRTVRVMPEATYRRQMAEGRPVMVILGRVVNADELLAAYTAQPRVVA